MVEDIGAIGLKQVVIKEDMIINDTKIKYLLVLDKIYEVTDINWQHLTLEAKETDLNAENIPEEELWDISYFEDFQIRLVNRKGAVKIVDIREWAKGHGNIKS